MGIIIDGFSHILPKTFAEALYRAHPTDELRELASFDYFGDMENRVRVLDKFQIDKQILTIARPSIWLDLPQNIVKEMTRLANEAVAEMAARQGRERRKPRTICPGRPDTGAALFQR